MGNSQTTKTARGSNKRDLPNAQGLLERFETLSAAWKKSESAKQLRDIIVGAQLDVTHAVCLGLGSLHPHDQNTSIRQLVAFLTVVDILKEQNPKIQVTGQDPVWTQPEVECLKQLGVAVVEDPEAFNELDEESFLFCPGLCTYHLFPLALQGHNPALYIGDEALVLAQTELKSTMGDITDRAGQIEAHANLETAQWFQHNRITTAFPRSSLVPLTAYGNDMVICWKDPKKGSKPKSKPKDTGKQQETSGDSAEEKVAKKEDAVKPKKPSRKSTTPRKTKGTHTLKNGKVTKSKGQPKKAAGKAKAVKSTGENLTRRVTRSMTKGKS